jgi:hypothetical protein
MFSFFIENHLLISHDSSFHLVIDVVVVSAYRYNVTLVPFMEYPHRSLLLTSVRALCHYSPAARRLGELFSMCATNARLCVWAGYSGRRRPTYTGLLRPQAGLCKSV